MVALRYSHRSRKRIVWFTHQRPFLLKRRYEFFPVATAVAIIARKDLEPQYANAAVLLQQTQLCQTSGLEAADGGVAGGEEGADERRGTGVECRGYLLW